MVIMARRRRRGSRKGGRADGMFGKLRKLVTPAAFGVSFIGQISAKDVQAYPGYNNLPNLEKAKFLGNSLVSHLTGFSPYPSYGTPGITINPTGPINKYTGMGVGLMVLSAVLPRSVGGRGLSKKLGKGLFWGGVIGGFLDPGSGTRSGGMAVRGSPGGLHAIGARPGSPVRGTYFGANSGY